METTSHQTHALVIGGGIAGLVTARVLTSHFDHVTLLERDHYPQEPTFRPGVPQGRQVHTMLLKGQQLLESLFPGISAKLYAQGAVEQLYGYKSIYVFKGRRCLQIPPVLRGWNCSRLLLEWQIRQFVQALAPVQILEGVEVVHLLSDPERRMVRGVQYRRRGVIEGSPQELEADFVVDASGATSRVLQWLEELGYDTPQETIVDAQIGYATQTYEQPADFNEDWTGIAIHARDTARRVGILMRIEQGRWMIGFSSTNEDYPSTQEEEFREFTKKLPNPLIAEALQCAKPLSPVYGYRRTENRFRHFERLKRFPEHFVVIGDAACYFNPVYGQGMTVAVLEALALDRCLTHHRSRTLQGLSLIFQRRIARIIRQPWMLVAAGDAAPKGRPSLASRYMDRIFDLLTNDPNTLLTFLEVMQMLRSPFALFHPRIMAKALFHNVGR